MAVDIYMVIVDPGGWVVQQRWISGRGVRDRVHEILLRPPDHEKHGFASWGRLTVPETIQICQAHYLDGLTPTEAEQLANKFPADRFWWALTMDW
jgi:hypothetical protein